MERFPELPEIPVIHVDYFSFPRPNYDHILAIRCKTSDPRCGMGQSNDEPRIISESGIFIEVNVDGRTIKYLHQHGGEYEHDYLREHGIEPPFAPPPVEEEIDALISGAKLSMHEAHGPLYGFEPHVVTQACGHQVYVSNVTTSLAEQATHLKEREESNCVPCEDPDFLDSIRRR